MHIFLLVFTHVFWLVFTPVFWLVFTHVFFQCCLLEFFIYSFGFLFDRNFVYRHVGCKFMKLTLFELRKCLACKYQKCTLHKVKLKAHFLNTYINCMRMLEIKTHNLLNGHHNVLINMYSRTILNYHEIKSIIDCTVCTKH